MTIINIANSKRISLSGIKNTMGRDGPGIVFALKLDDKVICTYADYGDGGPADVDYVNAAAKQTLHDLLSPHFIELLNEDIERCKKMGDAYRLLIQVNEKRQALLLSGDDKITYRIKGETSDRSDLRQVVIADLIEGWLSNQAEILELAKSCKKGVVVCDREDPIRISRYRAAFTEEIKRQIISNDFGGDASRVEFLNEKYGVYPSASEIFKIEYGSRLKELQTCKKVVFRVKDGLHDGDVSITKENAWRRMIPSPQNSEGKAAVISLLKKNHGEKLELMEDLLVKAFDQAKKADREVLRKEVANQDPESMPLP